MNNLAKQSKWLLAEYVPVSLFSLRMSCSTNKGGKTLFVPTPYAFKLAMVDASFRTGDEQLARKIFDLVKDKEIRFKPPKHLTVQNTFIKIKQEKENKTKKKDKQEKKESKIKGIYVPTIAYREFCFFQGKLAAAINITGLNPENISLLTSILMHINYLGKRGSFWQFLKAESTEDLADGFTFSDTSGEFKIDGYAVVQPLDDLGETTTKDLFDRVNTYSGKTLTLNKHRVLNYTFLPYRLNKSTRNYSYYKTAD